MSARIRPMMKAILFTLLLPVVASAQTWTTGPITYDGSGNIISMGTDRFVYDTAGRLVSGTADQQRVPGSVNRQDYSYDAFGNRLTVTTTGAGCVGGCGTSIGTNGTTAIDGLTNRITGSAVQYDAAGNLQTINGTTGTPLNLSYDAAGMVTRARSGTQDWQYVYTADDERIAIYTGQGNWQFTLRDLDGKVLRELGLYQSGGVNTWTWEKDHVYRDGLLLATVLPGGHRQQFHLDHLGTPRMVTDENGAVVGYHSYYPFGDELDLGTGEPPPQERLRLTGHERDALTNAQLDYMHARYYAPFVGRFLSVDPVLQIKRALHAPQMWNRYAHAVNNPMVFTDPTGTTVYLVTYTAGNSEADDELRRAAQTRAAEIQKQQNYDSATDTVLVVGVTTKADFAAAVKQANALDAKFGKVGEIDLYSHSGRDGPVFHDSTGTPTQLSQQELRGIQVNWANGGCARFFGCNSGVRFSQEFAAAQHVTTYGQPRYAYFSGSPAERVGIAPLGPVYLISAPGFHNPGPLGLGWLQYEMGNAYADPMVKSNP